MPEATAILNYHARFSPEEFASIVAGFIPEDMNDKWFAFVEGTTLSLHRSWTGFCIYRVDFDHRAGSVVAVRTTVNRDPTEYESPGDDYDVACLDELIRNLLLGKDVPQ
jgi:hypothetical protein